MGACEADDMLVSLLRCRGGASVRLLVAPMMAFAGGGIAGGGALVFWDRCLRAECENCAAYGRGAAWQREDDTFGAVNV